MELFKKYSLVLNKDAWKTMLLNPDIMQHFLFVTFHSEGLIVFEFEP